MIHLVLYEVLVHTLCMQPHELCPRRNVVYYKLCRVDTVTLWEAAVIKSLITERSCAISIKSVDAIETRL